MKCKIKLTWTNLSHQLGMLLQQFADRKHPQVTKACIHSMNSESSKWTCRTFSWIVFDINKIFLFRMWRKMYAKYVLQWIYVRITNDIWKTFIHSKCVVAYCTVDSSEKKKNHRVLTVRLFNHKMALFSMHIISLSSYQLTPQYLYAERQQKKFMIGTAVIVDLSRCDYGGVTVWWL